MTPCDPNVQHRVWHACVVIASKYLNRAASGFMGGSSKARRNMHSSTNCRVDIANRHSRSLRWR